MNREDYERAKERIEVERRRAIELMETAYDSQLRALELVWMSRGGGFSLLPESFGEPAASPAPPPPPAPPAAPAARPMFFPDLYVRVEELLDGLPDPFDRNDVCGALGEEPNRNALNRCLSVLTQEGRIHVQKHGTGRLPSIYRKGPGPKT
jgi:hypothetical protein